jgi:hypothetical protein
MPTAHAARTLVKSPPELWAELSDADTLGRRLQPFGEIRITRLEPETSLTWEADRVRGTVEIQPSGWGTRVTLTAESDDPSPPPPPLAPQPDPPVAEEEPAPPDEKLPQTTAALGQGYDTSLPIDPRPARLPIDPRPARLPIDPRPAPLPVGPGGFVSRLLGIRRRTRSWAPLAEPPAPEVPHVEPALIPLSDPPASPLPDAPMDPPPDVPVRPKAPQEPLPPPETLAEGDPPLEPAADLDEVLSGVLDDLGAAHHRPFSRG